MRDDRHRWSASLFSGTGGIRQEPPIVNCGDVQLSLNSLHHQWLISGSNVLTHYNAHGWPDIVGAQNYALCLRRDRVLVVASEPKGEGHGEGQSQRQSQSLFELDEIQDGWDANQKLAYTCATDLYCVFSIDGTRAFDVLTRGTELSLTEPSRSVVRRFFGYDVLLYRTREHRFMLHVDRAYADAVWSHLEESISYLC